MRLIDFSTTVAAEYSHRIDFSVWLDRCKMQLDSFRYGVLLSIAKSLNTFTFCCIRIFSNPLHS